MSRINFMLRVEHEKLLGLSNISLTLLLFTLAQFLHDEVFHILRYLTRVALQHQTLDLTTPLPLLIQVTGLNKGKIPYGIAGLVQARMSKIQGLFKDL